MQADTPPISVRASVNSPSDKIFGFYEQPAYRPQHSQLNQHQFKPSTELPSSMTPILGQTPQQRLPLANQTHSRSSSFFSFRNKQSADNQKGHQRTTSMGNGEQAGIPQHGSMQGRGPGQQVMMPPQYIQQQQQQITRTAGTSPLARSPSVQGAAQPPTSPQTGPVTTPPLHPEIRSVVQLTAAHAHKIYFSGPLVRRVERQPDGQKPTKDEGWCDVWAQLGGTTLSIWDMKQIQEASKVGKEVPPTYVNMTDAFVQVLGSITVPATTNGPAKKYTNVLTLNTAGSNLLLFSCPSTIALISWAAALRLSAWEKSRLEEIYTAHLIRITLSARDVPTTLVRGHMEGWVRIRIAGQTDWKRMWMIVNAGNEGPAPPRSVPGGGGVGGVPTPVTHAPKKKRMSNLFSRDNNTQQPAVPTKPMILMYASPKPKDKKKSLLSVRNVTQAFAVYPERPELITRSTLIKVEGLLGDEETAGGMKSREGWLLIMPELEGGLGQAAEMLKWVVALHDAFELYGRPEAWTWDPRDPLSLMFAYPVGPSKDLLFLDRELAETLDPRDDRTSAVRSRLINILLERMRGHEPPLSQHSIPSNQSTDKPPILPPIGIQNINNGGFNPSLTSGPQLPPLIFGSSSSHQPPVGFSRPATPPEKTQLSAITERSSLNTNGKTPPVDESVGNPQYTHGESAVQVHESSKFNRPSPPSPVPGSPKPADQTSPQLSNSDTGVVRRSFDIPNQTPLRFEANEHSITDMGGSFGGPGGGVLNLAQPQPPVSVSPPSEARSTYYAPPGAIPEPRPRTTSILTSPHSDTQSYHSPPEHAHIPVLEPPRRTASVLTSPHSIASSDDPSPRHLSDRASDRASVLTSPHSPHRILQNRELPGRFASTALVSPIPPQQAFPAASRVHPPPATHAKEELNDIHNEAGALFYMQQIKPESNNSQGQHHRAQTTNTEQDDDGSSSSHYHSPQPATVRLGTSSPGGGKGSRSPPVRQSTPMAFVEHSSPQPSNSAMSISADRLSPSSRPGLGRKPSGARAQTTRSYGGDGISSSHQLTEEEETQSEDYTDSARNRMAQVQGQPPAPSEDSNLDALAALSYLDADDEKPPSPRQVKVEPLNVRSTHKAPSPQPVKEFGSQFKSSFAPSKQAAERKAKAQAQQAAHHAAVHKPGRSSAKAKRKSRIAGAWNESSDEDEEEEDDDDDEDEPDSDGERLTNKQNSSGAPSSNNSLQHRQFQSQNAEMNSEIPQNLSHFRPPRTLPQIPANPNYSEELHPPPRRMQSDQYSEVGRRTYHDGTQIRTQAEFPPPGVARQSMWSQVLDPGRVPGTVPEAPNTRDTFVQLEPAETMTKAFTPQGLLSAGIQDKQDRSAKRQEELARETGASLINVPNKPPPPQMGLLGAITAHERDRKREGGVGAALTEREREKRLAEERQRRFDDHQRQQLDQMQQGGSIYGGQFPGYNVMGNPMMMMNPMMGMNPMITGGGLSPMMTGGAMAPMMSGFPGMMPGYNPQHMFAAQQAAQAYQQAMMAFSVAGSQVGGDGGGGPTQLNSAVTGGNMTGFDPRMSMMGMPMMGTPQLGMGMQMTGMSGFDPRFSSNMNTSPQGNANDPGLSHPGVLGGPIQGHFPSGNSSPVGRGSPLTRSSDTPENGREPSRPASPKR
ncbi:hypothetical protein BDZ94DRAFT_1314985 [Collybia nuda]|uniref:Skg3/CAF120-like PH-like domain-containing protein n=1 Tax=Collybia nuda TaxID=64659 RepID=A0A9P6CC10_9AGAR|nr:hypothetical protein BDZ94DRAFT_1314985 [Collybia nuda]